MICSFRLLSATDQRTNLAASRLRMHRPALHIQSVLSALLSPLVSSPRAPLRGALSRSARLTGAKAEKRAEY